MAYPLLRNDPIDAIQVLPCASVGLSCVFDRAWRRVDDRWAELSSLAQF